MKDLYVECNDMGLSEKEFKETFCNVCKNRDCVRADWAFTKWDKRILTQEQRFLNPTIVNQNQSSRWEGLSDLETLDYSGVVEVWDFSKKVGNNFKPVEEVPKIISKPVEEVQKLFLNCEEAQTSLVKIENETTL